MTAVEYLVSKIASKIYGEYWSNQQDITEYVGEALRMEKQQIIDAFYNGDISIWDNDSEKYYNETYGSKGSDDTREDALKFLATQAQEMGLYGTSSQTEISDEEIAIGRFMNWFLKHYSTATIDGFFGYVNAMGQEVRIQDILKDYRKLNGIENN